MKTLCYFALLWLCCGGLFSRAQAEPASEVLEKFDWHDFAADMDLDNKYPGTQFTDGSLVVNGTWIQGSSLNIDHLKSAPLQATLRTLGSAIASRVTSPKYAIAGTVKYEDVSPGSYLEMWSYFAPLTPDAPEGAYFSRTLGDSGPMAKIEGTDEGREFLLPFDKTGTNSKLQRIEFNLHLTGSGHVHLANVKLVQYPDGPLPTPGTFNGSNPLADGHLTIGVTMIGHKTIYTLAGMENVPLDDIRSMLKAPGVAGSSQTFSVLAEKDVPDQALKDLLDAFHEAGISDVKVTEVPSPPLLPSPANATTSAKLDWRSFLLGVLSTLVLFAVLAGLCKLLRHLRHLRHERELRRIASLDG